METYHPARPGYCIPWPFEAAINVMPDFISDLVTILYAIFWSKLSRSGRAYCKELERLNITQEDILRHRNTKLVEEKAALINQNSHSNAIYHEMAIQYDEKRRECIRLDTQNAGQKKELQIKEKEITELKQRLANESSQLCSQKRLQYELQKNNEKICTELMAVKEELHSVEAQLIVAKNKNQTANGTDTHALNRVLYWKKSIIPNLLLCAFWAGAKLTTGIKIQCKELKNLSGIIANKTGYEAINDSIENILWIFFKRWRDDLNLQAISVEDVFYCH